MILPSAALSNNAEKAEEKATNDVSIYMPADEPLQPAKTICGFIVMFLMFMLCHFSLILKLNMFGGDPEVYLILELLGFQGRWEVCVGLICLLQGSATNMKNPELLLLLWHKLLLAVESGLMVATFYNFFCLEDYNNNHDVFVMFSKRFLFKFMEDEKKQQILQTDDMAARWGIIVSLFVMILWNSVMCFIIAKIQKYFNGDKFHFTI